MTSSALPSVGASAVPLPDAPAAAPRPAARFDAADTASEALEAPLLAALDLQLLATVGVAPQDAGPAELMQAVAGMARQQLSTRWVETQAADRAAKARRGSGVGQGNGRGAGGRQYGRGHGRAFA